MRRASSSSARGVALLAAFCALGIAVGCGRETFDLLPDSTLTTAGTVLSGAGTESGGGGVGGNAGLGGALKAGAGGAGGRLGTPLGGGPGSSPCLGEGGCPDEEQYCPTECAADEVCNPFMQRCVQVCENNSDCLGDKEHSRCLLEYGVCVSCIRDVDCESFGPLFRRCFLNTCAQCSENWQCASQQVCIAGRCIKH